MSYTNGLDDPSAYFKVQLYTGDGSANHAITFDDTDTDMQPDLVWIKNRDATDSHCLFDAVRGATKVMHPDTNALEATDADTLDSFASDGFQVDADVKVNTNTEKYVAWCWKESATAGFDILTYTGTGSATTISHSLSAVPHFLIVKRREANGSWLCYHQGIGNTNTILLEASDAKVDVDIWNDTTPTSSVFSVPSGDDTNTDTHTYVSYLFAPKQGYSKFGSYEGNNASGTGSADGTFVYLGFRPAYVLIKAADEASQNWHIFDNKRTTYNVINKRIYADTNAAETTYTMIDFLSNGFKIRVQDSAVSAANTYIYAAFAEAPFVNSNGVPCNAR